MHCWGVNPIHWEVSLMMGGNCNALSRKIIVEDWDAVYAGQEIDENVKVFNSTILKMLDETIRVRATRTHPDKRLLTSHVKLKINARQRRSVEGMK